jgi:hypothetical protein
LNVRNSGPKEAYYAILALLEMLISVPYCWRVARELPQVISNEKWWAEKISGKCGLREIGKLRKVFGGCMLDRRSSDIRAKNNSYGDLESKRREIIKTGDENGISWYGRDNRPFI